MVRLPVYENDRALNTGSEFFRPMSDSGLTALQRGQSALADARVSMGRAIAGATQPLNALAVEIQKKDDRLANFAAQKALLDLDERTDAYVTKQLENISETGSGFHRTNMEVISKDAGDVLDTIPEHLRPEYEIKLKEFLNRRSDQLRNTEFQQGRNYISTITNRTIDRISKNVVNGVWDKATAEGELDTFLAGAGLPPETGNLLRREGVRAIELSRMDRLRQINPVGFLKESLKYMPNSPSQSAGTYQTMAIEQATAHGVDPLTVLTIGQIESSWNPNTKASKTIYGLYQLSKELRQELGIPEDLKGDPALQTEGIIRMVKKYQANLEANNIPVSATTVWASHFLGRGGVVAFWGGDPSEDAYTAYKRVAGANRADQAFNGSNGELLKKGMTVGDVRNAIGKKVAEGQKLAKGFLSDKPTAKADQPLSLLGETFSVATAADLGPQFGQAVKDVTTEADQRFQIMEKNAVDLGAINSYSPQGRELINKSVALTDLPQRLAQGDTEAFVQADKYIKQYNYLPAPLAQQALNMVASNDPVSKSAGYDLLYTTHAADPIKGLEHSAITGEMKKRVETYAAIRSVYKLPPNVAAAQTDKLFSEDYKKKLSKPTADDLKNEKAILNWKQIRDALELDNTFLFWGTDSQPNTTAREAVMARYRDRFEFHYRSNQDRTASRALAIQDIANSHGVSNITPQPQLVLYPPERYYPRGADGSHAYFKDQLSEYVTDYVNDLATRTNDPTLKDIDPSKISIAGTSDTGLDVQAGRYPRYEVFYLDHNGALQMVPVPFSANPERASGNVNMGKSSQTTAPQQTPQNKVDVGDLRKQREAERKSWKNPRGM